MVHILCKWCDGGKRGCCKRRDECINITAELGGNHCRFIPVFLYIPPYYIKLNMIPLLYHPLNSHKWIILMSIWAQPIIWHDRVTGGRDWGKGGNSCELKRVWYHLSSNFFGRHHTRDWEWQTVNSSMSDVPRPPCGATSSLSRISLQENWFYGRRRMILSLRSFDYGCHLSWLDRFVNYW